MKFGANPRKMYLLAIGLAVLACAVGILAFTWGGDEPVEANLTPAPTLLPTFTPVPTQEAAVETMTTVVYYQDNYGYLVPVAKEIPLEDGIAKATIGLMTKSLLNDMEAARLGLRTVLPENTQVEIDISGGIAKVDLSEEVLSMADAQSESVMVGAIVQALTEFDTVDSVRLSVAGQKIDALAHGTNISGDLTRSVINAESTSLDAAEAGSVTLYFPSGEGSLLVPVSRPVYGNSDINTAVLELVKGPRASGQLENALPEGVGLIGVQVVDGVAIVNFTKEFMDIVENTDGGRMALRALMLTCASFEGIDGVQVLVDGEDYDPGVDTMALPDFINDYESVLSQSIATQAAAIFE